MCRLTDNAFFLFPDKAKNPDKNSNEMSANPIDVQYS